MSKKYAVFLSVLFCVFLGGFFIANALTPDKEFSPMENRNLAQAPQLDVGDLTPGALTKSGNLFNGKFMEDFETYITDQFALRDQWIALKAGAEVALGKLENNGVYLCDRDTLISRFDPPATEKDVKRIDNNFGYVDTLASLTNVPVYFSLIPGKVSVWADRLPVGAPNDDESAYLLRGSRSQGAQWVDVSAALMAHREEDVFYRTDHHWTSLGAYYGYAALMEGMGLSPAPLTAYPKTTVSTDFLGTTFSSSGARWVPPDAIDLYVPQESAAVVNYFDQTPTDGQLYDLSKLAEKDKYSMFLGGNKPLTVVKSKVAPVGAPRLLLIRDSFSDSLAPFLTYNFSEIHLVDPRYYKTSMAQYAADNAIDQVLVLYSVDNFVKDGNLFTLAMPATTPAF